MMSKSAIRPVSGPQGIDSDDEIGCWPGSFKVGNTDDNASQEVFVTKGQPRFENYDAGHFTMNKDYVFFWNNFNVWYYDLNNMSYETTQEFHTINLNVDKNEKDSWIKLVRAGSELN